MKLFQDKQFDHDLKLCDPPKYKDNPISRTNHCTIRFATFS